MSVQQIQLLDDLGAEFARVADEHERSPRRPRLRLFAATPRGALVVAFSVLVLLGSGAYAVPPTRAAIDDLTSAFAGWVAGDEEQAPGRALRPEDDAPAWVREEGGRLIAESDGIGLYVTRSELPSGETFLDFALGNNAAAIGATLEGWRERFDQHAVIVLGPIPAAKGRVWDERGRFPLLGVTARSVDRLELRYATGPAHVADGLEGGFVLMADGRRALREIVAYDAAGRELERTDVSYIDWRRHCFDERGCPPGRFVQP